jgi:hypothetical protein
LFFSLCATFAASIAQLTFGLTGQRWGTWIALLCAMIATAMFGFTLFVVRNAIKGWVDFVEHQAATKLSGNA